MKNSNAVRILGVVGVCLIIIEAVLRLVLANPPGYVPRRDDDRILMTDTLLGFRTRGNLTDRSVRGDFSVAVVTDEKGHRIEPVRLRSPGGGLRIFAAGNSLTFGWGVEASDAWPSVLEDELARRFSQEVTVTNGGVSGYSLDQILALVRAEVRSAAPQMVVIGVYVGGLDRLRDPFVLLNGVLVRNSELPRLKPYGPGLLSSQLEGRRLVPFDLWLAQRSYIGSLSLRALATFWDSVHRSEVTQPRATDAALDAQVADLSSRLSVIADTLTAHGVAHVVALMATQGRDGRFPPQDVDLIGRLDAALTAASVNSFNAVRALEAQPEFVLRFSDDGHWNARAHRLVGVHMSRQVMESTDSFGLEWTDSASATGGR